MKVYAAKRKQCSLPGALLVCACDNQGYMPAHHRKFSAPLNGDAKHDQVFSRHKRIYNDPVGLRSARNQEPFLLQTLLRDTGEVLSELALPIRVDGRPSAPTVAVLDYGSGNLHSATRALAAAGCAVQRPAGAGWWAGCPPAAVATGWRNRRTAALRPGRERPRAASQVPAAGEGSV